MRTTADVVASWHAVVASGDTALLGDLLDPDCVFLSPVVHTPQEGRGRTALYLGAALQVFEGSGFHYTHELVGSDRAVLEFACELDGRRVHGVDLLDVRDGRITRFAVLVRPLQGIEALHRRMAAMLAAAEDGHGDRDGAGRTG